MHTRPRLTDRRQVLAGLAGLSLTTPAVASAPGWPLWTIKAHGGTVYLTGETPGGRADWSDSRIEALVPTCGAIWTEAGTTSRGPIGPLIARYALDPKTPLMSRLTEADKARLTQAAAAAHVSVERWSSYRPWSAANQLEQAYNRVTGLTGRSANEVITAHAKAAGVQVESEFPAQDDTLAEYGALPPEADVQFLRSVVDTVLAAPGEVERENGDWARGDLRAATKAAARFRRQYPELHGFLLARRNRAWIPRIETMLQAPKPSLVVVGNYHLLGPDGVLALLARNHLAARRT